MADALGPMLAGQVAAVLEQLAAGIEDLSDDQLHATPVADETSPGFNAWHFFRTADNIIHFAFYRDPTVWAEQELAEAWGLPRNDGGTSMPLEEVQAMRFPGAAPLARYGRDVQAAVTARLEGMDDEFLPGSSPARVMGELTELQRLETVVTVLVSHGNQHLGELQVPRQLLGQSGPAG